MNRIELENIDKTVEILKKVLFNVKHTEGSGRVFLRIAEFESAVAEKDAMRLDVINKTTENKRFIKFVPGLLLYGTGEVYLAYGDPNNCGDFNFREYSLMLRNIGISQEELDFLNQYEAIIIQEFAIGLKFLYE